MSCDKSYFDKHYDSIEFFMPMKKVPTATAQQRKITKSGRTYKPSNIRDAERLLTSNLYEYKPAAPFDGPLRLTVHWNFPFNNSHPCREWKTTKPDLDNLQKILQDCMTKLEFWRDDSQIVILQSVKVWDKVSGIYIQVEELKPISEVKEP